MGRTGRGAPAKGRATERLRRAAAIARSGAKRYPRELLDALIRPDEPLEHDSSLAPAYHASPDQPLAAAWLGHATVLLWIGGKWVLTDPVFSSRIGMKVGPLTLGLKRLEPPPISLSRLPPIDAILISHAHFDHLDRPTLARLARPSTIVVTATSTRRLIPKGFGEVHELAWDRELRLGSLHIHAIRPAHWGARSAWDRHRGFNSYVIDVPRRADTTRRVLYAGDTAMTTAYAALAHDLRGVRGVDLSIFGIGAYDPWIEQHATPEQVWAMHESAGGNFLLPTHHSTFRLSNEPADEPMRRLLAAAGQKRHRVVGWDAGRLWRPPTRDLDRLSRATEGARG